jgi:hypothetical protein
MSKKLIAVAAAAALALTGLVATPASATTISSVVINHSGSTGEGESFEVSHGLASAAVMPATAMTSRTLDFFSTGSTTRNVVRFQVVTTAATTVSVAAASGVSLSSTLTDGAGAALKVTDGASSLSISTVTGAPTATFYAWSTSTTAGTVTVTTPGSSLRFFVKGQAGLPYNVTNVKFPTTIVSGQPADSTNTNIVTWNVTDVFGNSIETAQGALAGFSSAGSATASGAEWSATNKYNSAYISGTVGSSVSLNVALTHSLDYSAAGWPKPVKTVFTTVSGGDLAAQVASLTAQVAALQAQLAASRPKANSVTKKRWNKLVRAHRALGGTAKLK